jgi:hypothetical protein
MKKKIDMEIPHQRRRIERWPHYLWEFFMLFLAVSLGFFVENRREHYVEGKDEKKYMKMLIHDLGNDIQNFDRSAIFRKNREEKLDSILALFGKKDLESHGHDLYRLALETDNYETFARNERTIVQLNNSGGWRLLINDSVSSAIIKYNTIILSSVYWNNETEASRIDSYKKLRFQVFNAQVMNAVSKSLNTKTTLYSTDPSAINELAGSIFQVKRISETNRDAEQEAKEVAKNLIALIKDQYGLE